MDQFPWFSLLALNLWIYSSWYQEIPPKETFPALFQIAQNKDVFVADLMRWNNGEMVWAVIFTRSFHDWELGSL